MNPVIQNDDEKGLTPVYVIGFPKSGNTWLARMLAEATCSNIDASDAVNSADNDPGRRGGYAIRKVHYVDDMEAVMKHRCVYIVRDVRDVLVSGFFHNNRWATDRPIQGNLLLLWYFDHEIRKLNKWWRGNPVSELLYGLRSRVIATIKPSAARARIGGWSRHVQSWTHRHGIVIVKYEDLLQNTEMQLKRVLSELDIDITDTHVKAVVANQGFERRKSDFVRSGDVTNAKFMRSGKFGDWKNYLSREVLNEIEKEHGPMMREMGYELESTGTIFNRDDVSL